MIEAKYFKTEKVRVRAQYLNSTVAMIMAEMVDWIIDKKIHPVITETVTTLKEDTALKRVSKSHRQGRAFDLRTKDWPTNLITEFRFVFEKKYGNLGAISAVSKEPHLLIHHNSGFGDHFHVQFSGAYSVAMPSQLEPIETKTA